MVTVGATGMCAAMWDHTMLRQRIGGEEGASRLEFAALAAFVLLPNLHERWRLGSAWLPQGICLEATPSLQPCLKREQQQQHSTPGGMRCSSTLSTAGTLSLAARLHKTVHQVCMPCMSLASACSLLCGPTTAILASCACARIEPEPSSTRLAWCGVPLTTDHARVLQHSNICDTRTQLCLASLAFVHVWP
jgi:hypothetical protein